MESLAMMVAFIFLVIAIVVFVIAIIVARLLVKKFFPQMHWAWYFLIIPGVMLISFLIAMLILILITKING